MTSAFRNGMLAGAAGTTALNGLTYLDMAIRARPSSSLPQQTVHTLADRLDVDLGKDEEAENRGQGLGLLLGLATGLTNPATWGPSGWPADLIPHLGHGLTTAMAYEAMPRSPGPRRTRGHHR